MQIALLHIFAMFFATGSLGVEPQESGLALVQRRVAAIHKPLSLLRVTDVPDDAADLSFINATVDQLVAILDLLNATTLSFCTQFEGKSSVAADALEQAQAAVVASAVIPGSNKFVGAASDINEAVNASLANASAEMPALCQNVSDTVIELKLKLQENADEAFEALQGAADEVSELENSDEEQQQFDEKRDARSKLDSQMKGGGDKINLPESPCSEGDEATQAVYSANDTIADLMQVVMDINDTVTATLQLSIDVVNTTFERINTSSTEAIAAHPELPETLVSAGTKALGDLFAVGGPFVVAAEKMIEQMDNTTDSLARKKAGYDVVHGLLDDIQDACDKLAE